MATETFEKYGRWLVKEGYQPTTINVTLRHMETLLKRIKDKPGKQHKQYASDVKRYLRYVELTRAGASVPRALVSYKNKYGLVAVRQNNKDGRRVKEPLSPQAWAALKAHLRKGDDTAKLLVAYMHSPLRVSAFLCLFVEAVDEETVADKISRDWIAGNGSRSRQKVTLFSLLCPTQRCTYARMRTLLQKECAALKIAADLETLNKTFRELKG